MYTTKAHMRATGTMSDSMGLDGRAAPGAYGSYGVGPPPVSTGGASGFGGAGGAPSFAMPAPIMPGMTSRVSDQPNNEGGQCHVSTQFLFVDPRGPGTADSTLNAGMAAHDLIFIFRPPVPQPTRQRAAHVARTLPDMNLFLFRDSEKVRLGQDSRYHSPLEPNGWLSCERVAREWQPLGVIAATSDRGVLQRNAAGQTRATVIVGGWSQAWDWWGACNAGERLYLLLQLVAIDTAGGAPQSGKFIRTDDFYCDEGRLEPAAPAGKKRRAGLAQTTDAQPWLCWQWRPFVSTDGQPPPASMTHGTVSVGTDDGAAVQDVEWTGRAYQIGRTGFVHSARQATRSETRMMRDRIVHPFSASGDSVDMWTDEAGRRGLLGPPIEVFYNI